jgi:hypothetical protein
MGCCIANRRMLYDTILERRVIFLPARGQHEPKHQIHNKGIANVCINGEWNTLEVVIGNRQFDKIHRISGETMLDMFENGSCVPFLKFHQIQFMCDGDEPCILTYDIVSLKTPETFEFVYKSQQSMDKVDTYMTIQSVPLSFNNLIEKLTIHCEYPVNDIAFHYDKCSPSVQVTRKTNSLWELDFDKKPVNFSQIDFPFLCVWTQTTNTIRAFATGIQTAQSRYGLMQIV